MQVRLIKSMKIKRKIIQKNSSTLFTPTISFLL